MTEHKHEAIPCMVEHCGDKDSGYWIPYTNAAGQVETFYMCAMHMEVLAGFDEDGNVRAEAPRIIVDDAGEFGHIEYVEIGVYSCSEDCHECNN